MPKILAYSVKFPSDVYSMQTYQTNLTEAKKWARKWSGCKKLPNGTEFYKSHYYTANKI